MGGRNDAVSCPRRAAHLALHYFNTQRVRDLGNASLGPPHAGADEVFGGD